MLRSFSFLSRYLVDDVYGGFFFHLENHFRIQIKYVSYYSFTNVKLTNKVPMQSQILHRQKNKLKLTLW